MESDKRIVFYFGTFGAWLPMLILIVFMLTMAATGNISLIIFSLGAFVALCASFLLTKNKKMFEEAVLGSFKKDTLAVIIMAFLLAGVLSQLLRQSGLINGLLWLTNQVSLDTGFIPLLAFLTCVVISTSCGTTGGTVTAVTPVMLPLAVGLGCDPGVVMGAIISGSIFGDNLAPISDTTIASALTQEAEIKDVVKTRLPYSLISGTIASILYIIVGFHTKEAISSTSTDSEASYALTLILLLLPIVMVFLMIKGWNLISTLIVCILLGIVINLGFGFISFADMISIEGPIAGGLSGMLNIILFCVLLFAILEVTERSGVFEKLIEKVILLSKTPKRAELGIAGITVSGNLAIGGSAPAIVFIGPFVRKITKKFNIDRTRGSNIMDGLSTAVCGMLPYNPSFLVAMGLALSSGVVDKSFNFMEVLPYTFHSMGLILLFLLSIATGIGRTFENEQNKYEQNKKEVIKVESYK